MSDPITISGGKFVDNEHWLEAIRAAGFSADLGPGAEEDRTERTLQVRFGHPSLELGYETLVVLRVEAFSLPRVVPEAVQAARLARLEQLRASDAPRTILLHEAMVVGWITEGRAGVEAAIAAFLDAERQREGNVDEYVDLLAKWRQPVAAMQQTVLIEPEAWTPGHILAAQILAAAYAAAAGGSMQEVTGRGIKTTSGDELMTPAGVERILLAVQREVALFQAEIPDSLGIDEPFIAWRAAASP